MQRYLPDKILIILYIALITYCVFLPIHTVAQTSTETPTATPTVFNSPTPTNTFQPSPTPTLIVSNVFDPDFATQPRLLDYSASFVMDPNTHELLILRQLESDPMSSTTYGVYSFPWPESKTNFQDMELTKRTEIVVEGFSPLVQLIQVGSDGSIYLIARRYFKSTDFMIIKRPNGDHHEISLKPKRIEFVPKQNNIPNAEAGDAIILAYDPPPNNSNSLYLLHQDDLSLEELELNSHMISDDLPIQDFVITRSGTLNILSRRYTEEPIKLFWVDQNLILHEWMHENLPPRVRSLEYSSKYHAFFAYNNFGAFVISLKYKDIRLALDTSQSGISLDRIHTTSNGTYFQIRNHHNSELSYIGEITYSETRFANPTATPVPCTTPTPKPITGWFVLDGFGGIHKTNPDQEVPTLPYLAGFNIIRDIEPDPRGLGWYMLDGFGGIHTDPPTLPKPDQLPYFGFDIARNLEVRIVNGRNEFYLLDGFGVIHSTDPDFTFGTMPFFTSDLARELEHRTVYRNCFIHNEEWLVMDRYGTIYLDTAFRNDSFRFAHQSLVSPIMQSFVRFRNDTTVMIDHSGGIHTNPFHPAENRVDGLPQGFYFPGWEIIWDLEVIREE